MAENQTHSNFYGSPYYLQMRKIHLRIEMQIFSLHWMMQKLGFLMSVKPEGLLGDIKTLMFCIIQCKLKI